MCWEKLPLFREKLDIFPLRQGGYLFSLYLFTILQDVSKKESLNFVSLTPGISSLNFVTLLKEIHLRRSSSLESSPSGYSIAAFVISVIFYFLFFLYKNNRIPVVQLLKFQIHNRANCGSVSGNGMKTIWQNQLMFLALLQLELFQSLSFGTYLHLSTVTQLS